MIFGQGTVYGVLLLALPLAGAQSTTVNLSGTWKLDAGNSDDAEKRILSGAGQDSTHGLSHLERSRVLERLVALARASDTLEIEQTARDFQVADKDGNLRIYYPDGKKHSRETPWGASLDAVAEWKDQTLVVTTNGEDIGEVREIYGLEGRQLVSVIRIRSKLFEDEIVVRHYYDRKSN